MRYPVASILSALVVSPALALADTAPTQKFVALPRSESLTNSQSILSNEAQQWRFYKGVKNMTLRPDIQLSEDCPCKTSTGECRKDENGNNASNC